MKGRDATKIKINAQVSFHLMALSVLVIVIQTKKSSPIGMLILRNVKSVMITLLLGKMENTVLASPYPKRQSLFCEIQCPLCRS